MKKRVLLTLVVLLLLVGTGLYTYARYQTSWGGEGSVNIASWAVSLSDGSEGLSDDFALALNIEANDDVAEGYIAPGGIGTATMVLDLSGTQVSVDYGVSLSYVEGLPDGMNVTGVTARVGAGDEMPLTYSNGFFGDTVSLSDIENGDDTVTITITIEWTNSDSDDRLISDTEAGEAAGELTVPITVTVKQHI